MNMDDRQLLLLGLLRIQDMHGYQLNQFLEEHLEFLPSFKPPTAYYTLEKMAEKGLVKTHSEQTGNRPTRQIFGITPAGEQRFQELLRRNLANYEPIETADDIGIGFLNNLPIPEARQLVAQKQAIVQERLNRVQRAAERLSPENASHLSLVRNIRQLETDLSWLAQVEIWLHSRTAQQSDSTGKE
jgi:DNA-binding PadR family transcriptional regulator